MLVVSVLRNCGTSKLLLSTQFLSWRRRERIDKEEEEEDNG
jgi:hypothetical protein